MALPRSQVTAQGQFSGSRRDSPQAGDRAGSVLEWDEEGDKVFVRKAGRYTSLDIDKALFLKPPKRRSLEELENSLEEYVREHHARR